jgi:hypothetical protein
MVRSDVGARDDDGWIIYACMDGLQGTGLPFNRYSWLTTHNSFAITGTPSATGAPIVSPPNQEDSVTGQLNNGVRGLMLDTYDFKNDLWLCHSFAGKCYDFTAYVRN